MTDTGAGTTGGADQRTLLDLAVGLARDASSVLGERRSRRHVVSTKSSGTDMVTEVDRASEALIVAGLRAARPHDAIVGEEGTADTGTSGVRWLVDPLDGTTNYLYGYHAYAVSIAAEVDGEVVVGVVADASNGEVFTGVAQGSAGTAAQIEPADPATVLPESRGEPVQRVEAQCPGVAVDPGESAFPVHRTVGDHRGGVQRVVVEQPSGHGDQPAKPGRQPTRRAADGHRIVVVELG